MPAPSNPKSREDSTGPHYEGPVQCSLCCSSTAVGDLKWDPRLTTERRPSVTGCDLGNQAVALPPLYVSRGTQLQ